MDLTSVDTLFTLDSSDERSGTEIILCSVLSAGLVGLSGILPLLVIPVEAGRALKHGAPAARLKILLSFAAGSILGDVFLHLLPEAWIESKSCGSNLGLGILLGIMTFFVIEKIFADDDEDEDELKGSAVHAEQNCIGATASYNGDTSRNGHAASSGRPTTCGDGDTGRTRRRQQTSPSLSNGAATVAQQQEIRSSTTTKPRTQQYQTRGYLNLLANLIDNFTHGLAVGASFLVSRKVGFLTTFAILVHEIPHEVGDFAILLRSGFSRWDAAGAQALTASGAMIGALTALSAGSLGYFTAHILAFTSGGFIYIAMVTVMPDLLKEHNHRESFKQVVGVCVGICVMALVNGIAG